MTLVLLACVLPPAARAEDDSNVMCPVLSDREATDDYVVTYKGKEIRFCCSECIIEFNKHPEIYEAALPQLQKVPLRVHIQEFMGDYGFLSVGSLLLVVLIVLRVLRLKQPSTDEAEVGRMGALLQKKISGTVPLMLLSGYLGFEVYSLQAALSEQRLIDAIHFATFHDFGYPPTPRRPDTEPRLKASFYRGNDERSPKLFNNGNYRTATFNVSLCDDAGAEVSFGDNIEGKDLFVKFEVDRPPFTPDFLYQKDVMDTMFLTAQCDHFLGRDEAVQDAVGLTETEPMQKWTALFPIRRRDACSCSSECTGTVYICEKYFEDSKIPFVGRRQLGARFHYALRYDLSLKDGIVSPQSDLYMGALYRTRKLPTWRVPMTQWFSHEPIPVLPGENVTDPTLLGITDHLAKVESEDRE